MLLTLKDYTISIAFNFENQLLALGALPGKANGQIPTFLGGQNFCYF